MKIDWIERSVSHGKSHGVIDYNEYFDILFTFGTSSYMHACDFFFFRKLFNVDFFLSR